VGSTVSDLETFCQVVLVGRKGDPNPMIRNLRLAAEAVLTTPAA
jgi:hypothetical protein